MLISEISNCHFGSMDKAKELIKASLDAGADLVKAQAIKAESLLSGSMPREFYKQCEFSLEEYIELIHYARSIGTDLFYSIFDPSLDGLYRVQKYIKVAKPQFMAFDYDKVVSLDKPNCFISMPNLDRKITLEQAKVLYVNDYNNMSDDLTMLDLFQRDYKNAGFSDHSIGPGNCIKAITQYGIHIIETHLTLER